MSETAAYRYRNSIELAEKTIKADEGLRLELYKDTVGKLTIGYGRCLDDTGITRDEAEYLFHNDIIRVVDGLKRMDFWKTLSANRQAVLINMTFCLGIHGIKKFKNMIAALRIGDYSEAAAQILDSKFARQTGQRANRLAVSMAAG